MLKKRFKVKTSKRKKTVNLNPAQWLALKKEWLAGEAFINLATKYNVSVVAIDKHAAKHKWRSFAKSLEEFETKTIIKMFAKAELPPEKLIKEIANGAKATYMLKNVKTLINVKISTRNGIMKKPLNIDKTIEVIDNVTTFKYREMAARMLNLFPAPKMTVMPESRNNKGRIIEYIDGMVKDD